LRNENIDAVGMKPIASGMQEIEGDWVNEDVQQILQASGGQVDRELVNQYAFDPFIAPHIAAAATDCAISINKITAAYEALATSAERVIVEGAGGLMTPLNETQTFVDLIHQLELGVVLVVAVRLGCINHALLTQQVLRAEGMNFVGWVANYPDPQQPRDIAIEESLKTRLHAPLLGAIPWDSLAENSSMLDISQIK